MVPRMNLSAAQPKQRSRTSHDLPNFGFEQSDRTHARASEEIDEYRNDHLTARSGAQRRKTRSVQGKHRAGAKVPRPAHAVRAGTRFEAATCGLENSNRKQTNKARPFAAVALCCKVAISSGGLKRFRRS